LIIGQFCELAMHAGWVSPTLSPTLTVTANVPTPGGVLALVVVVIVVYVKTVK